MIKKIFVWIGYAIVSLFFLFPVLWVFSLSLKTKAELFEYPPTLIPKSPTFDNFRNVFQNTSMWRYLFNSFELVVFTVLGTLLVAIPAGYAFSRFRFKNKQKYLFLVLVFQMISPVIIGIPIYKYYASLGLINNYFGLVMVYIAVQIPFTTFLIKGGFDAIPKEFDEAARIDGATRFQLLRKIIIPVSLPSIASATIFTSINAWSQFLLPFILIDKEKMFPVSVGILLTQGNYQEISTHFVAAASVISLVPAVLMVIFLQKFIIKSLTAGALKG
ncbi:MAG: carbohydrate ABC transporter permease [Thermotogota bacterium]|nr:carbohydrate ABC transporter permease [Thermotogota bacterium]